MILSWGTHVWVNDVVSLPTGRQHAPSSYPALEGTRRSPEIDEGSSQ